jgi:hypothetical protein
MVGPAAFAQSMRLFNGVPEPASVLLAAIAAAGMIGRLRVRRLEP